MHTSKREGGVHVSAEYGSTSITGTFKVKDAKTLAQVFGSLYLFRMG